MSRAMAIEQRRRQLLVAAEETWPVGKRKVGGIWTLRRPSHALRHPFCSHLAMKGAAPVAIQALVDESVNTTKRYLHLQPMMLLETAPSG